jgi:hypothetical protein
VTSTLVRDEIEQAPEPVKQYFEKLRSTAETVYVTKSALELQKAYFESNVISPKWETDALHVAVATVSNCNIIVSWNFKHIVNFQRIPLYNKVNLSRGYSRLEIFSPMEVRLDEETI